MRRFGAGKLRHVIALQSRGSTQNSYGEPIRTWTNISSAVRAEIQPVNAAEVFANPKMTSVETKNFILRYTTGIDTKDRIVWNGRNYNIEGVTVDEERGHFMTLLAVRVNT